MKNNIAKMIIEKGLFNKELPSEFNSKTLAEKVDIIDVSKSTLGKKGVNKWSKLVQYSIPKQKDFRRTLSIPHPLHYLVLSKTIQENWSEIENHCNGSKVSLSSFEYRDNELIPKYSMNDMKEVRLENLAFNKYILCVDIWSSVKKKDTLNIINLHSAKQRTFLHDHKVISYCNGCGSF